MRLTNDTYVILLGTKNFTERYYRDQDGWLKVSARGREFRMTAEQVLNHLLPALAGLKPGVIWSVEHHEPPPAPRRPAPRTRSPRAVATKAQSQRPPIPTSKR